MDTDLEKATNNDKRRLLSRALTSGWLEDFDESFVYFESYDEESNLYKNYKAVYTMSGVTVTVDEDNKSEIEFTTIPVDKSNLEGWLVKTLDKYFGPSKREKEVIKMFDEEQMIVVEPLYVAFGEVDAHGETYKDKNSVYQLVDSFNAAIESEVIKASFFHTHETDTFAPIRAFVNEDEVTLGDHLVPALQPLVEVQFKSKVAYDLRKSMDLLGVSIGARALSTKAGEVESTVSKSAKLDTLKNKGEAETLLSDFSFDWEGSHLAYTDESTGGAASLKNYFYLAKSKKKATLSEEQKRILDLVGEEFRPLDKSIKSTPTSAEEDSAGEDVNVNKDNGSENIMSEKEQELEAKLKEYEIKLDNLEKSAKAQKAEVVSKELSGLGFEGEELEAISKAYLAASEEDQAVLSKALSSLKDAGDSKVAELKKELKEKGVVSDLEKEVGADEDATAEASEPLSLQARVNKAREDRNSKESK